MSKEAIVSHELAYWYGDLVAVDHVSFTVAEGEILGFLGPNGAGKSTTVKILTGQLRPKSGRADVLGMDVDYQNRQGVVAGDEKGQGVHLLIQRR